MVLRFLMRYFSNNERLVQKLSESYPVRRAAQVFVSFYFRGQSAIKESGITSSVSTDKLKYLLQKMRSNFSRELKNARENLKNKKN